jgi:drug/metabolite transporter (DMT)-like permease
MHRSSVILLTLIAMIAFAANTILCRLALKGAGIDAASFTAVRLVSGALVLWLIVAMRSGMGTIGGSWPSALALFSYAAPFSFAYVTLPTGAGALLLFGAVQATMIFAGLRAGERLNPRQTTGLVLALAGLVYLMLPGLSAPPLAGSLLMIAAGISWGVYSLRGRGIPNPLGATAGNFMRAAPLAIGVSLIALPWAKLDMAGAGYAIASGAVASGMGYAIWYAALRGLKATSAATVQLSVPVIASAGGVVLVGEPITLRLVLASLAILGGIALVILSRKRNG